MTISGGRNGANKPLPWMCPALIQPVTPVWSLLGGLWPQKGHLWPFGAQWRPPMAVRDPGNGPMTSPWMCPTLIQP